MKTCNNRIFRIFGAVFAVLCAVVTTQAQNVAYNRPGTASSVQGTGLEASKAFDGNYSSRWSSASSDPQWIYVDLGTCYRVNQVILTWENASAKNYTIDVANSASGPWTTVATQTSMATGARTDMVPFPYILARYVRISGYLRTSVYGYSLYEMEVDGVPPTPENILVLTEKATYNLMPAKVDQYVQCLRNEGFTVYSDQYVSAGGLPMDQCKQVLQTLTNYYYSMQINGAVFIGNIPYAQYIYKNDPNWPPPNYKKVVDDYYYMDIVDNNNKYNTSYHTNAWPDDGYTTSPNISMCDNHAEIWVSRIAATNIVTTELRDVNGAASTNTSLVSQYLDKVIKRMTVAENVPPRLLSMCNTKYWTNPEFPGLNTFYLATSNSPRNLNPLADNPANWQGQLQNGPYGNLNMQAAKLANNGFPVLAADSRTFGSLVADTFGFEWAGLIEHSDPTMHFGDGSDRQNVPDPIGFFTNTDAILKKIFTDGGDQASPWADRTYTSMYPDGGTKKLGHAKSRFYIDEGCDDLNITYPDCLGLLWGMAGNGLISIGTTITGYAGGIYDDILNQLSRDSTKTIGSAFLTGINDLGVFPVSSDIMMCFGAGTLKAKARLGYSRKYIQADYAMTVSSVSEAANTCTGNVTFTSRSPNGTGYNAASTVYKWYNLSRTLLTQTGPTIAYTYNPSSSTALLTVNGVAIAPNTKLFIEASQSGYLSGFINTDVGSIASRIPSVGYCNMGPTSVTAPTSTNWWVDNISGQLLCSDYSPNSIGYNYTKTSYKLYDSKGTLQTTLTGATGFSYRGSTDQLTISGKSLSGAMKLNGLQTGYMMGSNTYLSTASFLDNIITNFNMSGIIKATVNSPVTITTFTPTVSTTNSKFDVAGTTTDNSNVPGGIIGEVCFGNSNCEILAKDTLFLKTGSANQKAGVIITGSYNSPGYNYVYLYQKPDGSVWWQTDIYGIPPIWSVASPGEYQVGSTWFRMKKEGDVVSAYISTDNKLWNLVTTWPFQYSYTCSAGIMYSSGGVAGSARVVDINIRKY